MTPPGRRIASKAMSVRAYTDMALLGRSGGERRDTMRTPTPESAPDEPPGERRQIGPTPNFSRLRSKPRLPCLSPGPLDLEGVSRDVHVHKRPSGCIQDANWR